MSRVLMSKYRVNQEQHWSETHYGLRSPQRGDHFIKPCMYCPVALYYLVHQGTGRLHNGQTRAVETKPHSFTLDPKSGTEAGAVLATPSTLLILAIRHQVQVTPRVWGLGPHQNRGNNRTTAHPLSE